MCTKYPTVPWVIPKYFASLDDFLGRLIDTGRFSKKVYIHVKDFFVPVNSTYFIPPEIGIALWLVEHAIWNAHSFIKETGDTLLRSFLYVNIHESMNSQLNLRNSRYNSFNNTCSVLADRWYDLNERCNRV
ncbi:hypothetical protein J6590_043425 [Homalodisca vitripennis]|nr:hypothetical protein J6590_043425 [Homalodisca vitripennis]